MQKECCRKSKEWTGTDRDLKIGVFLMRNLARIWGTQGTYSMKYYPLLLQSQIIKLEFLIEWTRKDLVSIQNFDKGFRLWQGGRSRSLPSGLLESKELCRERWEIICTCVSVALTSWAVEFQNYDGTWPVTGCSAGGDAVDSAIHWLSPL